MMPRHLDAAAMAAYLDRGLPPDERERAADHLADCAECRARLAAQVRAEARGAAAPIELHRGRRTAWLPLLAAAAVGAVLLGVGLWLAAGGRSGSVAERGQGPAADTVRPGGAGDGEEPGGTEAPAPGVEPAPGEQAERDPVQLDIPDRVPPSRPEEELLALRGATRVVEGRTFRLQGDTWIDGSYRQLDHGGPREVERGSPAYEELAAREPRLARWAEIGPRVLVVLDSVPYRIVPPPPR